jgi:hypothetical protein
VALVYTRQEAADALKVSLWVLDIFIADGKLPTVRYPSTSRPGESNRRVLIAASDLESFVTKHREVKA